MELFWLIVWLVITVAVSYYNASIVGRWWSESKEIGGGVRFLIWCGAIMAVSGFFMVYLLLLTLGMYYTGAFVTLGSLLGVAVTPATVDLLMETVFDLAFLIVILPVLGSGFAIWAHSMVVAWYRRDVKSIGIALWNTFAQTRNTVTAVRHIPKTTRRVSKNTRDLAKAGGGLAYLILLLLPIVISLGLAIFTVVVIARAADEKYTLADLS